MYKIQMKNKKKSLTAERRNKNPQDRLKSRVKYGKCFVFAAKKKKNLPKFFFIVSIADRFPFYVI
jgi:hypothetical protein